jgi:cystathionine beta-lyase
MYDFDRIIDRENTSCIKYDFREKIFENKDVTPMWVADMDFETPDFVHTALEERMKHHIYGYTIRRESYYNSIVEWVKRRHNWRIEKDWIIFSPGIVPALSFSTLLYTNPGDTIIVQPPVYFPFFSAVNDHNRILSENQLVFENDRYEIDFNDFERRAKEAVMFFFSSPHNPVGRLWTRTELEQIGKICVDNNVLIISDEIHNDLILPGNKHIPLASISKEIADITVTCIAPSKTFNLAGMSTSSLIISNDELRSKMNDFLNSLHISLGNIFGAVASEAAYTKGDSWVDELMEYILGNLKTLRNILINSPIKLVEPEATYMAWLDFRNTGLNDDEIKSKLVNEAGLGLSAGSMFGKGGEGFQRINLASPNSVVKMAAERIVEVFG